MLYIFQQIIQLKTNILVTVLILLINGINKTMLKFKIS
jgi:hypothetical protein